MDAQTLLYNSLNNEKESKAKYQAKLGNGKNSSWIVSKLTKDQKLPFGSLEDWKDQHLLNGWEAAYVLWLLSLGPTHAENWHLVGIDTTHSTGTPVQCPQIVFGPKRTERGSVAPTMDIP